MINDRSKSLTPGPKWKDSPSARVVGAGVGVARVWPGVDDAVASGDAVAEGERDFTTVGLTSSGTSVGAVFGVAEGLSPV
jgi:hypothetical protein